MAYENNQHEKKAKEILDDYIKDRRIFIDTCSILYIAANKFWMNSVHLLAQYQNKVIILLKSTEELQKYTVNSVKPELAKKAKNTLEILQRLMNAGENGS